MNEMLAQVYGLSRAVWRRRWVAVAISWAVALLGWAMVLLMPDRYEASARVFVDARTALRPVLEGIAIQEDYESQLALVREALLSRPQLETVVRRTNLDAGKAAATPAGLEALIGGLQQQIHVATTEPSRSGGDAIYTISYQHPDRAKSIEVVRTLVDNFVEGTLSGNRSGSIEAQNFLNEQIAELEKRLQDAESRLADFKKRNIGLIPGERGDYFTRRDLQTAGLQQANTDLAVALSRQAELKRQLANTQVYLPGTTGGAVNGPPDVTVRRQDAEQKLEDLLLRFTDKHPDVIALRRTIDELKGREAQELATLQKGGAGTGAIRSLAANPVYQQVQGQLNQVQVEIASHQGAIQQHQQEIANLRKYVDQAPEVEQQFAQLNRDYNVTRDQYQQFVARREKARVSDDAARTGIVRFDVIEPPHAPLNPSSPKRPLLFIAVLVAAVGVGVGLALLPQLLAPTFTNTVELERRFGLPVLGSVSVVRTADQQKADRREVWRVTLAGAVLAGAAGILVVVGSAGARVLHHLMA